jgi:hypothetical protein
MINGLATGGGGEKAVFRGMDGKEGIFRLLGSSECLIAFQNRITK